MIFERFKRQYLICAEFFGKSFGFGKSPVRYDNIAGIFLKDMFRRQFAGFACAYKQNLLERKIGEYLLGKLDGSIADRNSALHDFGFCLDLLGNTEGGVAEAGKQDACGL